MKEPEGRSSMLESSETLGKRELTMTAVLHGRMTESSVHRDWNLRKGEGEMEMIEMLPYKILKTKC